MNPRPCDRCGGPIYAGQNYASFLVAGVGFKRVCMTCMDNSDLYPFTGDDYVKVLTGEHKGRSGEVCTVHFDGTVLVDMVGEIAYFDDPKNQLRLAEDE